MTLAEWIENKKVELQDKGYRSVVFKDAVECGLAKNAYQIAIFTAPKVPMDAQVREASDDELPDSLSRVDVDFANGVYVSLMVLPPRKRKPRTESYQLLLA